MVIKQHRSNASTTYAVMWKTALHMSYFFFNVGCIILCSNDGLFLRFLYKKLEESRQDTIRCIKGVELRVISFFSY